MPQPVEQQTTFLALMPGMSPAAVGHVGPAQSKRRGAGSQRVIDQRMVRARNSLSPLSGRTACHAHTAVLMHLLDNLSPCVRNQSMPLQVQPGVFRSRCSPPTVQRSTSRVVRLTTPIDKPCPRSLGNARCSERAAMHLLRELVPAPAAGGGSPVRLPRAATLRCARR